MGHIFELWVELLAAFAPGNANFRQTVRKTLLFMTALAILMSVIALAVSSGALNFLDSRRW